MTSANSNRKLLITGAALAALVLFGPFLRWTMQVPEYVSYAGPTMGTTWNITFLMPEDSTFWETPEGFESLVLRSSLDEIAHDLSTYEPESFISKFNQIDLGLPFPLTDVQRKVFLISFEVCEQTGGAFDITVGPLVDAWGFGAGSESEASPPPAELDALLAATGCDHVSIVDVPLEHRMPPHYTTGLQRSSLAVQVDLSAVAKGYGVDRIAEQLLELGVEDFMIEIGGEVRAHGLNSAGGPWRIGIQTPDPGGFGIQRVVELNNRALATSGDYRNFREEDGKRLSHIIDPRNGYPVDHTLASVSVLHEECAWADAYATALMVLGPEEGFAFAEEHGLDIYMIIHDGDGFVERTTPGFDAVVITPSSN